MSLVIRILFIILQDKKRLALMQKEDPRSQEVLDKKIEGVVVNREALDSAVGHNALNLPPHNASATTPQEAYPLDRIILRGEWDYLLDIFNLVEEGAEVLPDAYPMFVRNRIHKLKDIQVNAVAIKLMSGKVDLEFITIARPLIFSS